MRKNIEIKGLMAALLMAMLAVGCVTPRRVDYLQDMTQGSQIELENRFEARVAPYDELDIRVMTSQTNSELAVPFNLGANGSAGYLVDVNGCIDFPVLGHMKVAGFTRLQLQDTLESRLSSGGYLDDPFVTVRFSNFKIFVIGNGSGRVLTINNERCTFLEALAMMGGLDNYTRRDRIGVMREVDGKMMMRYLDPRSSNVFRDPFFMMQQNDFIVLDGMNANTLRMEITTWMSTISALASAVSLIVAWAALKNRD